jgi:hypothetical protein
MSLQPSILQPIEGAIIVDEVGILPAPPKILFDGAFLKKLLVFANAV